MTLSEKLLCGFTAVILGVGIWCFTCNQDIYREVGNAHPARGYAEFVNQLSNEEFVLVRFERWEQSNSWVLNDLHNFLTGKDAALHTTSLVLTQAVITFTFYYCFACIPFILLTGVRAYQRQAGGKRWST